MALGPFELLFFVLLPRFVVREFETLVHIATVQMPKGRRGEVLGQHLATGAVLVDHYFLGRHRDPNASPLRFDDRAGRTHERFRIRIVPVRLLKLD